MIEETRLPPSTSTGACCAGGDRGNSRELIGFSEALRQP